MNQGNPRDSKGNPRDSKGNPTDNRAHTDFMDFMSTEEGKKLAASLMGKKSVKDNPGKLLPQRTLDPKQYKGGNRKSKKNKKTEKRKIGKGKISKTRSIRKSRKNITGGMLPGRLRRTNNSSSRVSMSKEEQERRTNNYMAEVAEYEAEQKRLQEQGFRGRVESWFKIHPGDA